jgi:hypothetical protein
MRTLVSMPRRLVFLLLAAVTPAAALADGHTLTDSEVAKALPILRVRASGAASERAAMRADAAKLESGDKERRRQRDQIAAGRLDPLDELRSRGVKDVMPAGYRYEAACSRKLSKNEAVAVLTSGKEGGTPVCVGLRGLDQASPGNASALDASRKHLARLGFQPMPHQKELLWLPKARLAAEVYGATCVAREAKECDAVPSGPLVVLRDATGADLWDAPAGAVVPARDGGKAAVDAAVKAAGLTDEQWSEIEGALQQGHLLDAQLPKEGTPAFKQMAKIFPPPSADNVLVYRRHKAELKPLMDAALAR